MKTNNTNIKELIDKMDRYADRALSNTVRVENTDPEATWYLFDESAWNDCWKFSRNPITVKKFAELLSSLLQLDTVRANACAERILDDISH